MSNSKIVVCSGVSVGSGQLAYVNVDVRGNGTTRSQTLIGFVDVDRGKVPREGRVGIRCMTPIITTTLA